MNPNEVEFLAENQTISIIPSFNSGVVELICGDIGPFRASLPTRVPLWVAINLKQQRRCKIQPPHWMDVEFLEDLREKEKRSRTFVCMPSPHYMIEAKLLLQHASDDIDRAEEIRIVIKDIWDMRMSKIRSSAAQVISAGVFYASVDHLTLMEINSMRPLLPHAMDQLYRLKKTSTASQANSTLPFFQTAHSSINNSTISN